MCVCVYVRAQNFLILRKLFLTQRIIFWSVEHTILIINALGTIIFNFTRTETIELKFLSFKSNSILLYKTWYKCIRDTTPCNFRLIHLYWFRLKCATHNSKTFRYAYGAYRRGMFETDGSPTCPIVSQQVLLARICVLVKKWLVASFNGVVGEIRGRMKYQMVRAHAMILSNECCLFYNSLLYLFANISSFVHIIRINSYL